MQTRSSTASSGVVQWVAPPTKKPKRATGPGAVQHHDHHHHHHGGNKTLTDEKIEQHENRFDRPEERAGCNSTQGPIFIDMTICRTICSFVEMNLKELEEHQRAINLARNYGIPQSRLNSSHSDPLVRTIDVNNLKVRDEQTKANATIKQLTNYLRELTFLERQCNSVSTHRVDEEIVSKLSDARSDIIQALNDFILSNSDFDLPIIDVDDINGNEYDLCTDARTITAGATTTTTSIVNPNYIAQQQRPHLKKKSSTRNDPPLIVTNDSYNDGDHSEDRGDKQLQQQQQQQQQSVKPDETFNIEKRRRDIVKLERDTEEMRQLFSEFYNLVKCQGEQIDSIENNIVITAQRISEGQHTLNKARRGLTILMPVTGCMAGALIGGPLGLVIGGKLGGLTFGCVTSLLGLISSYSVQRCIAIDKIKDD